MKKILTAILLFPWSVAIVPALPYLDKLAHSIGVCFGG